MQACLPSADLLAFPCPEVSILMPVFNAEAFLAEAVHSVFAQTSAVSRELLLIDDGSTDGSLAIARRFEQAHPVHIRVLQHPGAVNCGTSASRNLGLRHARGAVLAFLDADDVWLPHMLEVQLGLLARFPRAAMVYANAERTWNMALPCLPHLGPQEYNTLPALLPPGKLPGCFHGVEVLRWMLAEETLAPCTCTVLVRTEVARAVGGFEDSFDGLYDDQVFYAKVLRDHRVAVSSTCVARYRRHHDSCCAQAWENASLQASARASFEDWLSACGQEAATPLLPTLTTAG